MLLIETILGHTGRQGLGRLLFTDLFHSPSTAFLEFSSRAGLVDKMCSQQNLPTVSSASATTTARHEPHSGITMG